MAKLRVLDLFSGIGGFSLGLERTGGFETVAFCEIEEFPRKVLKKHWPNVMCYRDVRELTGERIRADGISGVDVVTGGFPCQDISEAGKRRGLAEGTRSGLWGEIVRIAGDVRPAIIIVENVADLLVGPSGKPGAWFGRVLGDLAELGYDAEWENIPAAAVGASHRRERVWIVAHDPQARDSKFSKAHYGKNAAWEKRPRLVDEFPGVLGRARSLLREFPSEPGVGRMVHGVPRPMDRLGALGNAVVPQIPELIGHAILQSLEAESTPVSRVRENTPNPSESIMEDVS